jgi:hypothetical protein
MIFYNPKLAAFKVEVSTQKEKIQIMVAPAVDPNRTGRPQKGEQVFDWNNCGFFSLLPNECWNLARNWDKILRGTYKDPKATNPEYEGNFTLVHYLNNQPSRLTFKCATDTNGNPNGSIHVYLSKTDGKSIHYILRLDEQEMLKEFIIHGYKDLPYECAFRDGLLRQQAYDAFQNQQKEKEAGSNRNTGENSRTNYQRANQPPAAAKPSQDDGFPDPAGGYDDYGYSDDPGPQPRASAARQATPPTSNRNTGQTSSGRPNTSRSPEPTRMTAGDDFSSIGSPDDLPF